MADDAYTNKHVYYNPYCHSNFFSSRNHSIKCFSMYACVCSCSVRRRLMIYYKSLCLFMYAFSIRARRISVLFFPTQQTTHAPASLAPCPQQSDALIFLKLIWHKSARNIRKQTVRWANNALGSTNIRRIIYNA